MHMTLLLLETYLMLQVQETTAGPGLHNRHFKYTATGGTFMAKISKSNPTIPQEAILDNFFAEQTGLEVQQCSSIIAAKKDRYYRCCVPCSWFR